MLCKLVLSEPDVLVMDEPTNHLDIASREMLEEALDDYTGTIIAVSHDRYFLDRIVDKLLVIGTDELGNRQLGRAEFINDSPAYSAYAAIIRQRVEAQRVAQETQRRTQDKARKASDPTTVPQHKTPEELRRFNKYSVDQIEEMILQLEHELEGMKQRFGDADLYRNPGRLAELQQEYGARQAELDLLYRAYDRRTRA
jgi:ATP-binding cassette subfamily F protein 3